MTPELFAKLAAQNFNRIPITRQVLADLETPLSVYLKLALGPNSYLFESVQGGEKWGALFAYWIADIDSFKAIWEPP